MMRDLVLEIEHFIYKILNFLFMCNYLQTKAAFSLA